MLLTAWWHANLQRVAAKSFPKEPSQLWENPDAPDVIDRKMVEMAQEMLTMHDPSGEFARRHGIKIKMH